MTTFKIAVLPGDGIGPEVVAEGTRVLKAVERRFGHRFEFNEAIVGGAAIDKYGVALLPETLDMCKASDAVLFGAVGGPKWDDPRAKVRPEQGLLGLRKGLGLFANLRPVKVHPLMVNSSTLKSEVLDGTDIIIIRELTGGLYFGQPKRRWENATGRQSVDTNRYSEKEVRRVLQVGFDLARQRRKKLTSVDKANVLETGRMWREIAIEMGKQNPDIELDHILVDACAMHLIRHPSTFDVIVTENTFGDILTDEASMLVGSMGMLPSASIGKTRKSGTGHGLYEPIHGTAPDIAGQGKANPLATILSVAMMLRLSLGLEAEAQTVEKAVDSALQQNLRTPDIAQEGTTMVNTSQMGDAVAKAVLAP
ncbi:MAG TPA: 3-isopropylmalate dehydrogenase [Dehalococcoidia bacterium]